MFVINAFFSELSAFTVEGVDYASKHDEVSVKVRNFIFNGWPRRNVMDEKLLPYFVVRNEFYCLAKSSVGRGATIEMPERLYSKALQVSHEDRFGIVRPKQRSFAWWPRSSAMFEQMV